MKKKILFLFIFIFVTASFSMKFLDDKRSEESLDRAFAKSNSFVKQEVKVSLAAPEKKVKVEEIENFDDVEGLDFSNSTVKVEEIAAQVDTTLINEEEFQIYESLPINKKVTSYELPNANEKIAKVVERVKNESYSLSLKEPVKVSRVISKRIESTKWAQVKILVPEYKDEMMMAKRVDDQRDYEFKVDRISMTQASNEKSKKIEKLVIEEKEKSQAVGRKIVDQKPLITDAQDDLVFFDYSNPDVKQVTPKTKQTNSTAIVVSGIGKSSKVVNNKTAQKPNIFNLDMLNRLAENKNGRSNIAQGNLEDTKANSNQQIDKSDIKTVVKNMIPDTSPNDFKKTKSNYTLQAYRADNKKDLRNFDVRFSDDQDEILTDNGTGEVAINRVLTNTMGIRRTTILSKGNYPTVIDIVLEDSETSASVPVFSRAHLGQIMDSQKLRGNDSFLLIELDTNTEDVDIDAKYEKKLFLDKNLKVVTRDDSDFNFIFFIGAQSGNTVISFKTVKNEIVSKIIHLSSEEVYFDPNFYIDIKKDDFDLFEDNLLSKTTSPLSLDSKDIEGLTFDANIKKKTSNKYEISEVKYPLGTRSYVQLKHLDEPIFLGRFDNTITKVPSESYMRYILGQFSIGSVKSQCLVQINLRKSAKEFYFNGLSSDSGMRVEAKILDKDGLFYSDLSSESEKIFILGEEQGIINIQVKYSDGSFDFLQSYCSESTYLVEQL